MCREHEVQRSVGQLGQSPGGLRKNDVEPTLIGFLVYRIRVHLESCCFKYARGSGAPQLSTHITYTTTLRPLIDCVCLSFCRRTKAACVHEARSVGLLLLVPHTCPCLM